MRCQNPPCAVLVCFGATGAHVSVCFKDMVAVARAAGVDFVPHQTQPTVGHMANLHFTATLLHGHYPAEYADMAGQQGVVLKTPLRPRNGKFILNDSPGLGLEIDEDQLEKRMIVWRA